MHTRGDAASRDARASLAPSRLRVSPSGRNRTGRHLALERSLSTVLLIVAILPGPARAADWSRYPVGRLGDLAAEVSNAPTAVVIVNLPVRARVTYTGEFRPLHADAHSHIATWAAAVGLPKAPPAFQQELGVLEGRDQYWLPVQDVLVAPMRSELTAGEEIEVFAVLIGSSSGHPIFLVNEFVGR